MINYVNHDDQFIVKRSCIMINIHIFLGATTNRHAHAICGAKSALELHFGDRLVFSDVNHDEARLWGWSEEDLIDWLTRDNAIYINNCHPHQGASNVWSPAQLKEEFGFLGLKITELRMYIMENAAKKAFVRNTVWNMEFASNGTLFFLSCRAW
jgi:hypothetical protein